MVQKVLGREVRIDGEPRAGVPGERMPSDVPGVAEHLDEAIGHEATRAGGVGHGSVGVPV
jgi:hypothetical protein